MDLDDIDDLLEGRAVLAPHKTKVVGSKGASYTITVNRGRPDCTCPGYGWRGKCKHITNFINQFN